MQYFRWILALFLVAVPAFALTPGVYDRKPTIIIAADEWCPINCGASDVRQGVGIDLARIIFEPMGYKIQYDIMPWSDALVRVRTGAVQAVIGATRNDDATLIFPDQNILKVSDDFYVMKGDSWRFQGMHTLKNKKLGVIKDYGYGATVQNYIVANQGNYSLIQTSEGTTALKENIRKLMDHKIDVLTESKAVMSYTIDRMHLDGTIQWAGGTDPNPAYLAFSPALPASKSLAAQFDAGMRRLQAEGRLEAIYSAYGLSVRDR